MDEIKVVARKWGNSFGFVLPRGIVEDKKIKEGSEICITIEPMSAMTVGDLMKLVKRKSFREGKSTQKVLDEMDEELWSDG